MADNTMAILLHHAAADGDIDTVRRALQTDGVDIDAVDERLGLTPLGLAITNGRTSVARILLAAGAKTDSVGPGKESALLWAIRHRRVDVVDAVLAAGVDVDARDVDSESPLMVACRLNAPQAVEALLRAGADAHYTSPSPRESALSIAASEGFDKVVATLLSVVQELQQSSAATLPSAEEQDQESTNWGFARGLRDAFASLLSVRPEPRLSATRGHDAWDFASALACAIRADHAGVVQQLLDAGARLDQVEQELGLPPLVFAAELSRTALVPVLLRAGANVNSMSYGGSALMLSARYRCQAIAETLLEVDGIDVELEDDDGDPALLCAAFRGLHDVVRRLIEMGADVHRANRRGETADILEAAHSEKPRAKRARARKVRSIIQYALDTEPGQLWIFVEGENESTRTRSAQWPRIRSTAATRGRSQGQAGLASASSNRGDTVWIQSTKYGECDLDSMVSILVEFSSCCSARVVWHSWLYWQLHRGWMQGYKWCSPYHIPVSR